MPQDTPPIDRPELTFDPDVSVFVEDHYNRAKVILEYGSGGSTVLASEMPGKTIFSVESDKSWAQMMQSWFDYAQPVSMPFVQHVNVGKTGKWGTPIDGTAFRRYHHYPLSIWDEPTFNHPDVILIDGRFRVACALTAMMKATRKTTLLFDDYENRPKYHVVEDFLQKEETVGRMAQFSVRKTALPRDKLTAIIGAFANHS